MKVVLWIIGILAVLAAVFCGLYFGVPAVHDWVVNLFTPDAKEPLEQGAKTISMLLKLK